MTVGNNVVVRHYSNNEMGHEIKNFLDQKPIQIFNRC